MRPACGAPENMAITRPRLFIWICGLLQLFATLVSAPGCHSQRTPQSEVVVAERSRRIKHSPNYAGGRFANEDATSQLQITKLWSVVIDNILPGKDQHPSQPLPMVSVDVSDLDTATDYQLTWLGHSTVLIQIDGTCILTDPVFDNSVGHAVGSTPRFQPSPLSRENLPAIDAVLISHDHFDHLEKSTVQYLWPTGTFFFVPLGVGGRLSKWGVPDSQVVELDWWEGTVFESVTISCTPARHFSGRSLAEVNKTLWSSWVIIGERHRLYYGGDTGYSDHFERIGARFGPFDLTLLPIGAADEAWPDIHIGPEEAVVAHQALRGKALLPVHWGTFDLAAHAWDDPIKRLIPAAASEGVALVTPRLGEIVSPDRSVYNDRWWESID